MLVFKKGELIREVKPLSQSKFEIRLVHPDTRVAISTNLSSSEKNTIPVSKKPYYKITREDKEGKFDFFEEVIGTEKEAIEKFKEATFMFESLILETLNLPPENTTAPPELEEEEEEEGKENQPETEGILSG